jgi:hypothetical protein
MGSLMDDLGSPPDRNKVASDATVEAVELGLS